MLRQLVRSPAFASLRHRNFRLFLGGQFLSLCGTWIQQVAHGWLVLTLTDSALVLGLVSTLGSLPILLFTLIGGVVADRVNKRKFVMLLQGLMLTEALTLGILTAFGWITVPMIIVLAVFFGTLTAFEVPTRQAFVVDVVGKDDLVNAIALNSSAFNLARVIGPTIAGVTIAAVGIAACFFLNAASYVAVLAGLAAMKLEPGEAPEKRQMRSALREGFAYVLGEKWPRTLILLTATMSVFGYSFIIMLPVLARDELGVGAAGYGLLLAGVGTGALAAALGLAAFARKLRQGRMALSSAAAMGTGLLLLAMAPGLITALIICILTGCAMAATGISTNTLLQRLSPDHLRGRVMGFYSFVALGMAPFGSLQGGWVAERFGVRSSFALGGFVSLAAVGLVVFSFRRVVRAPRTAELQPREAKQTAELQQRERHEVA